MPKFTDKVESAKDYNAVRHLMKSNKKMSEVLWELSLRPDAYKKDENKDISTSGINKKDVKYFSQQPKR